VFSILILYYIYGQALSFACGHPEPIPNQLPSFATVHWITLLGHHFSLRSRQSLALTAPPWQHELLNMYASRRASNIHVTRTNKTLIILGRERESNNNNSQLVSDHIIWSDIISYDIASYNILYYMISHDLISYHAIWQIMIPYHIIWSDTVSCHMIWDGTVRYCYDITRYDMIWDRIMSYHITWYDMIAYNVMWYDMISYAMIS